MSDWPRAAVGVAALCGVVAWGVAVVPFIRIARELRRAREAGEARDIPIAIRGLPVEVIFTRNILPRVEKDRQRLVQGLLAFVACWLVAAGIGMIFGLHH
jgi:hypothetical protein